MSLIDTTKFNVPEGECDPKILQWLSKANKDFGQTDLINKVKVYPWTQEVPEMDFFTPGKSHTKSDFQKTEKSEACEIPTLTKNFCDAQTQTRVETWMREVPCQTSEPLPSPVQDLVWAQIPTQNSVDEFLGEMLSEVEVTNFQKKIWTLHQNLS